MGVEINVGFSWESLKRKEKKKGMMDIGIEESDQEASCQYKLGATWWWSYYCYYDLQDSAILKKKNKGGSIG